MSGLTMLAHLLLEHLPGRACVRIPETAQVMRDASQNAAFDTAGRGPGILATQYVYHALQIAPLLRPGDHVLDLACGPGNLLERLARLKPDTRFTGLDASPAMLDRAQATLQRAGCDNVTLATDDMTCLSGVADASMDAVLCTLSLHHLPDLAALQHTMLSVRRVLKNDGALYLMDFGRFKYPRTQRFFAEDRRKEQTAEFTLDYFNSLRAAFSMAELSAAVRLTGTPLIRHCTPLAPFMIVFRSAQRHVADAHDRQRAQQLFNELTPGQQRDFHLFARWFALGGFRLELPGGTRSGV